MPSKIACADDRDAARRRRDEANREQRNRTQVRAQVAQAGEERSRVEQRRQDRDEHEVRRQLHLRQPGDEPEEQPADDERTSATGMRHERATTSITVDDREQQQKSWSSSWAVKCTASNLEGVRLRDAGA